MLAYLNRHSITYSSPISMSNFVLLWIVEGESSSSVMKSGYLTRHGFWDQNWVLLNVKEISWIGKMSTEGENEGYEENDKIIKKIINQGSRL